MSTVLAPVDEHPGGTSPHSVAANRCRCVRMPPASNNAPAVVRFPRFVHGDGPRNKRGAVVEGVGNAARHRLNGAMFGQARPALPVRIFADARPRLEKGDAPSAAASRPACRPASNNAPAVVRFPRFVHGDGPRNKRGAVVEGVGNAARHRLNGAMFGQAMRPSRADSKRPTRTGRCPRLRGRTVTCCSRSTTRTEKRLDGRQ